MAENFFQPGSPEGDAGQPTPSTFIESLSTSKNSGRDVWSRAQFSSHGSGMSPKKKKGILSFRGRWQPATLSLSSQTQKRLFVLLFPAELITAMFFLLVSLKNDISEIQLLQNSAAQILYYYSHF